MNATAQYRHADASLDLPESQVVSQINRLSRQIQETLESANRLEVRLGMVLINQEVPSPSNTSKPERSANVPLAESLSTFANQVQDLRIFIEGITNRLEL